MHTEEACVMTGCQWSLWLLIYHIKIEQKYRPVHQPSKPWNQMLSKTILVTKKPMREVLKRAENRKHLPMWNKITPLSRSSPSSPMVSQNFKPHYISWLNYILLYMHAFLLIWLKIWKINIILYMFISVEILWHKSLKTCLVRIKR